MSNYVLDTSALLAYIENEEGANEVEVLLLEGFDEKHTLYVSIVSLIEVYYISSREQSLAIAMDRLEQINNLPVINETISNDIINVIGNIKATCTMSFADCCIAGLAIQKAAILVHKDPEFEQVPHLQQHKLTYK